MSKSILLSELLVCVRLKKGRQTVSWLISRVGTRVLQEKLIRFWNTHGVLPENIGSMPRLAPAGNAPWRRESL